MRKLLSEAAEYLERKRRHAAWMKIVCGLACVVVFCTVYALILPAITLEKQDTVLECPVSVHQHTADCYDAAGSLICGQADYVIHVHNDDCKDKEGNLICQLPEIKAHEHSGECYTEKSELNCGQEESEEHQHTSACYRTEKVLVCDNTAVRHSHSESCYDMAGNRICGQLEVLEHQHEDGCFQKTEETNDGIAPVTVNDTGEGGANSTNAEPVRLMEYANNIEGSKVQITVSNSDGQLEPGQNGQYEVVAGEEYNVRVAYSGTKIAPGKYYVTFTSVSNIDLTQTGQLILTANNGTKTDVGRWYFEKKEDGVAWLIFDINDEVQKFSNIDLVADVTCEFDYTDQPLAFDGLITVNVIRPPDEKMDTEIGKWAENNTDPNKIFWKAGIGGHQNSKIPGSTFYDKIDTTETHHYTQTDMENGITITAGISGSENIEDDWHQWVVKPGDPGLDWKETEWSYTMPESIQCSYCGKKITLQSDGWTYYLEYTSTRKQTADNGYVVYKNEIQFDSKEAVGITTTSPVSSTGEVVKTGTYSQGDEDTYDDDVFNWTITTKIPGAREGEKYDYSWYLMDTMGVEQGSSNTQYRNDLNNPISVTAKIGENEIAVPNIFNNTNDALIVWANDWSVPTDDTASKLEAEQIFYGQKISFANKCQCTQETCQIWENDSCLDAKNFDGYCRCWNCDQDVIFTLTYKTDAPELIEKYGGQGAELKNDVKLVQQQKNTEGKLVDVLVDDKTVQVPIPGIFTKQLTGMPEEDNGYLAEYTITVNEAMANLSELQELTIKDTMTTTLGFLSDSLKIHAKNADGKAWEVPSDQYTVTYQPNVENSETQEMGNLLTITLKQDALGPYQYTLVYGTSVSGGSGSISYKNTASIQLFGKNYDVSCSAHDVPNAVISGETYGATLYKCDSTEPKLPLRGAVFGLYTAEGDILMKKYKTDDHGLAQVKTDTSSNVILRTHVLYYLQELEAPDGYRLDDTKHYFWFCNNQEVQQCSKTEVYTQEHNATCVYTFKTGDGMIDLQIPNEKIPDEYELPETGGPGTLPVCIGGLTLLSSAGYLLYRKAKRRREELGDIPNP